MESFLSGFSHSYEGTQVGQGYTGNVSLSGSAGSVSAQGVDVTQLQPGDTFQGEIVSVNGEDVQIQLTNGQYMAAKLERDVQVALGQFMNLQVQSNKDNRVVLKPVYDGRMQMLRVGEAALRAAHMAVSDRNLTLVSTLLENGMSINKNTLMLFNRLTLQNPGASMTDLIKLNKLQLPVNDNSLTQLQNYQNMEHKLLDGIREASDEILKLYDTLTGKADVQGNQTVSANAVPEQGTLPGQAALENGGKFMEQVLVLLAGEEGQTGETQAAVTGNNSAAVPPEGQNIRPGAETVVQDNEEAGAGNASVIKDNLQESAVAESTGDRTARTDKEAGQLPKQEAMPKETQKNVQQSQRPLDTILAQLKGEKPQALPNKIISLIREGIKDGKLEIKDMKQLLMDGDPGKQLTAEQKAAIFRSEPFKSMLKNGLQKQWTLTPQELTREGRVEEFYQKLAKESSQLSRMMNEAMQASGQSGSGTQARAMGNISENVEFMNQMNQMFNYVQLPLKLSNSQAHGDLYVYTNKKNLARKDGMLTAFLHLDMDNLGALDVSISLQTERNQVTTKFYLDEDSIALVEGHIDELAQRLSKKGYQCKNMILEKEEDKTVLEHMEEQVAGGSAVLSYQTFDTRA
ncbi:MAG: flagellar hook-length control protein FliK [Lachnospiraceae bacterium]|nr:flagellar hook-length control protein FliK [Lachnospiraceae bacterium]